MVEYHLAVLEAVRAQAVDGLLSIAPGGMEIGGVLYGERRGGMVRILAARQLECEHAHGPAFILSENDELRFRELLKPRDGLRAVGWYGSHTRSGVGLGANDSRILQRFFPERGSVALLVRPLADGPADATFHVQGYAEPGPRFTILPAGASEIVAAAVALRVPAVAQPRRIRRMSMPRWAGVGVCLALFAAWFISLEPDPKAATSGTRVGLQVYAVTDRNVRIEWDRTGSAVRAAQSGIVKISDGRAKFALPLNGEQLRDGSLTYAQQTDVLDVSMKLATGIEESARFVAGPERRNPTVPQPVRQQQPAGTRPEVAQRSQPAERQAEFAQQPAGGRKTLKPFILTAENRTARAAGAVLPDPPPAVVPSVRVPTLALAPAPVRPVPRQSSGRLVWTGDLGRRGVVAFEGGSATVGSLVGRLPGVPSRFMVFPAEFKDDGIQVYTNDASRHNRTEAPGPSTGWNRMVYVWDPERVKQLIVVEAPNPGNQFSRLSLRNNRRSCPVIVVDWWTD